jgi:hypothetical protein
LSFFEYLWFLDEDFREKSLWGGQSADLTWTIRNEPQIYQKGAWLGWTVCGLPVDGPRWPGGRSTVSWWTVRLGQRAPLTAVDFAFLPLEFKLGHSVVLSWTVLEVRVLCCLEHNG